MFCVERLSWLAQKPVVWARWLREEEMSFVMEEGKVPLLGGVPFSSMWSPQEKREGEANVPSLWGFCIAEADVEKFWVGKQVHLSHKTGTKIYLDDERLPPPGWLLARWPQEVIAALGYGGVEALSLDHDLGDDARGTGYDVILWLEEAVLTRGFVPPNISVHSANISARQKMEQGIASIRRHLLP